MIPDQGGDMSFLEQGTDCGCTGFKREFSKLIGFLIIAIIAVGLVFNAAGVKDILLELFNRIIGA